MSDIGDPETEVEILIVPADEPVPSVIPIPVEEPVPALAPIDAA